MKKEQKLYRIDVKGGVLSTLELQQIIEYAIELELECIHFGSRQDIIFPLKNNKEKFISQHPSFDPGIFAKTENQNISSSYVSMDIFDATVWLRGTTYLYLLEEFTYDPKFKINIIDPKQQIVPLFSGDLNFIASSHENYWYLFLKLPNWEEVYYPVLVYTWDIAKIAEGIENIYEKVNNVEELFQFLNESLDTNNKVIEKPLHTVFHPFPYYEGMNKMGIDQYWLGLYWRNNRYDLKFLKALCEFCVEHRIGKICLTPWKSFIIKGIAKENKLSLEKLLGRFGINIRHSALELNWYLPVNDQKALQLKEYLVKKFDQNDISTYGLTFAITSKRNQKRYFTSIVIEENIKSLAFDDMAVASGYNVLYAKNFDPNSKAYLLYAQDVGQTDLPDLLLELTKTYFKNLGTEQTGLFFQSSSKKEIVTKEVYQCRDCDTIYDSTLGDSANKIPRGIKFNDLPADYCCPLCESPKENFKKSSLSYT